MVRCNHDEGIQSDLDAGHLGAWTSEQTIGSRQIVPKQIDCSDEILCARRTKKSGSSSSYRE